MIVLNVIGGMTFDPDVPQLTLPKTLAQAVGVLEEHREQAVLLLEGGGDISPYLYGQKPVHTFATVNDRDLREQFLYTAARRMQIPVIGICRGHQMMAALEGGTLHQDISAELGITHGGGNHPILFDESTPFFDLQRSNPYGKPVRAGTKWQTRVNSLHHQSVDRIPDNAQLAAISPDGVIEALVYPRIGVSVQYHPEIMGHNEMPQWVYEYVKG